MSEQYLINALLFLTPSLIKAPPSSIKVTKPGVKLAFLALDNNVISRLGTNKEEYRIAYFSNFYQKFYQQAFYYDEFLIFCLYSFTSVLLHLISHVICVAIILCWNKQINFKLFSCQICHKVLENIERWYDRFFNILYKRPPLFNASL